MITINSASISSSGVISVTYTLADPNGLPLDATGATTPGVVSLGYVAAYIPKGQEQYVAYTTEQATGPCWARLPARFSNWAAGRSNSWARAISIYVRCQGPGGIRSHRDHDRRSGWQPRSHALQPGHQLRRHHVQLRSQWLGGDRDARCDRDRELQHLSLPVGLPRRLRPWHPDVRPVPPRRRTPIR